MWTLAHEFSNEFSDAFKAFLKAQDLILKFTKI